MDLTQGNIKKQLISMAVPAGIGIRPVEIYITVVYTYSAAKTTSIIV